MSSIPEQKQKVQTNLKLTAERAMALDIAAAVEQKDKARIVEEALALREELMGSQYQELLQAALALRFSTDPAAQLTAIRALQDDAPGSTPDGSVSVSAALARLRARSQQTR
jgi:hypothetical protein